MYNWLIRGERNEFQNMQKPSEALQVVAKATKGQRAGKGYVLFSDQSTKGTLEAQRAQCPWVLA